MKIAIIILSILVVFLCGVIIIIAKHRHKVNTKIDEENKILAGKLEELKKAYDLSQKI